MKEYSNHSLLAHNTFGIEARCNRFVEYETTEEAIALAQTLGKECVPPLIIGAGSNLLLTNDYPGTVVHSGMKGVDATTDADGSVWLKAASGETWDDIVAICVENEWYGAENLSIIPGEVGASAVQNIGAYGVEAKDLIASVEVVEIGTGNKITIAGEDCGYSYRHSHFKDSWKGHYLITHVTYHLNKNRQLCLDYGNIRTELERKGITAPTLKELRQTIIDIRNSKLPDTKLLGNAGSFFMNPIVDKKKFEALTAQYPNMPHYIIDDSHVKIPAGWLIDQCGWKGRHLGNAAVYERQALVLVNCGSAKGTDIIALMQAIQKDVASKFGIDIQPEVNIL